MADIDPRVLESFLRTIEHLDRALRKSGGLFDAIVGSAREGVRGVGAELENVGRIGEEAMVDLGEGATDAVDIAMSRVQALGHEITALGASLKREFEHFERTPIMTLLAGHPEQYGLLSGNLGGLSNNLGQVFRDIRGSIVGGTELAGMGGPLGVLLGAILEGGSKTMEFQARSNQVVSVFDRVGGGIRDLAAGFGPRLQDLSASLVVSQQDLTAAFGAMAQHSQDGRRAFDTFDESIKGFGHTVGEATVAFDKYFSVQSGFTAEKASQLSEETGRNFKSSVQDISKLEFAAKSAGVNVELFVGNIMQATSALRLHRQSTDDVVQVYNSLAAATGKAFGTTDQAFIGRTAGTAIGQLSGFAQGMPEGLKALLGQRMFGNNNPLENLMRFDVGQSQGGDFMSKLTSATLSFLQETRMGQAELYRFLKQMGAPTELAAAMINMREATMRGAPSKELENLGKVMQDAFSRELAKKSPLEQMMEEVKNAIAIFGQLIIDMLAGLIRAVVNLGQSIIEHSFEPLKASTKYSMDRIGSDFDRLGGSLSRLGTAFGRAGENVFGQMIFANQAPTTTPITENPYEAPQAAKRSRLARRFGEEYEIPAEFNINVPAGTTIPPGGGILKATGTLTATVSGTGTTVEHDQTR